MSGSQSDDDDAAAESSAGHVCIAGIWLPINSKESPDAAAPPPATPRRPPPPLVETETVRRNLRSLALAVCQARGLWLWLPQRRPPTANATRPRAGCTAD